MTSDPLIENENVSDAGGVAGRIGFKYQDHVGAGFVIDMLRDGMLFQVEFETADDLTLRWRNHDAEIIEYVQVKTTEDDKKWSMKEIMDRDKSRVGSSLAEKSLNCDKQDGGVQFRFVSRRDIGSALRAFGVHRDKRTSVRDKIEGLKKSIGNKYKTALSPKGRSLTDWASTLYWQVEGSIESLGVKNINKIIQQAENSGEIPSHTQAKRIYDDLLQLVAEAGDASRVANPAAKVISREAAIRWWRARLDGLRMANRDELKVYRVSAEPFFSDLHSIEELGLRRSMRSYDVEFDDGVWRGIELIDYLLDWLPEVSLPAKVLAEFSHLEARGLTRKAVEAVETNGLINDNKLLVELLLHAVLRQYFNSEPIACKVFYGHGPNRTSTSAHIVPNADGDQLWIGRSRVTTVATHEEILKAVANEMETALLSEFLRDERNLIISLREPRHMRSSTIDSVFSRRGKTEDLRRCLCLPILIAYDSDIIRDGFTDDYVEHLRSETIDRYSVIKTHLPASLTDVQVHVFLIPMENPTTLLETFGRRLRGI